MDVGGHMTCLGGHPLSLIVSGGWFPNTPSITAVTSGPPPVYSSLEGRQLVGGREAEVGAEVSTREVEVEKSSILAMKVVCWRSPMPGTLPITSGVQPLA